MMFLSVLKYVAVREVFFSLRHIKGVPDPDPDISGHKALCILRYAIDDDQIVPR